MMVSVSEENISGIDTHFRKYRIGGIDTIGIVSPITICYWSSKRNLMEGNKLKLCSSGKVWLVSCCIVLLKDGWIKNKRAAPT